jgi:hypothetical protein
MSEVIITPKKTRLIWVALGCLLFVVAGYFMIVGPEGRYPKYLAVPVGTVAIAFFGGGFLILTLTFFYHNLNLVINDFGITDRTNGFGQISWSDIEGFKFREKQIFLKVKNIEKYVSRLSGLRKWLNKFNGDLLEFGLIEINVVRFGVKGQDILRMLDATEYKSRIKVMNNETMYGEPLDEH